MLQIVFYKRKNQRMAEKLFEISKKYEILDNSQKIYGKTLEKLLKFAKP